MHLSLFFCLTIFCLFISYFETYAKEQNCYQQFGVSEQASEKEIKRAFRKLALKYHPDKATNEEEKQKNDVKFKELAGCYEILSNDETRKQYDMSGKNEQFQQKQSSNYDFSSFDDIFSQFFGNNKGSKGGNSFFTFTSGGSGASGSYQGSNHGFPFGFGGESSQQYSQSHQHQNQNQQYGNPKHSYGYSKPDDNLQSKNIKPHKINIDLEDILKDSIKTITIKTQNNKKNIELTIPKGIPNHEIIESNNYQFEININSHAKFRRGNNMRRSDLFITVPVTLNEALLGSDIKFTNIDGEKISFYVDKITSGMKHKLKHKGLPRYKGNSRGDLYVEFDIILPNLNSQQKTEFEKIASKWKYPKQSTNSKK